MGYKAYGMVDLVMTAELHFRYLLADAAPQRETDEAFCFVRHG
jgi:hypothetical protein